MFDQLLPGLQCGELIELFMVNTNKTDPLLAVLHNRLFQPLRMSVKLERVHIQCLINFNRPHCGVNVHDCLNSPNDASKAYRPDPHSPY